MKRFKMIKAALSLSALTAVAALVPQSSAHAEAFNRVYQLTLSFNSSDIIPKPAHFGARMDMGPDAPTAQWSQQFTSGNAEYILNQYTAKCRLTPGSDGGDDDGTVDCRLTAQISHTLNAASGKASVRTFLSTRQLHMQLKDGQATVELPPPNKYFTGTASIQVISS